jgi:DNA-binding response OmpR family regulator
MAKILIIEDDAAIRQKLANTLANHGHEVTSAPNGMAGVQAALEDSISLVVLDLGLPDIDGSEVLRLIRAIKDVPVLVATARDDQREIVELFDAGADDYVVKPFTGEHLEARIRAVLRRSEDAAGSGVIEVGNLTIDLDSHEVTVAAEPLELTAKEFELLSYLAANEGKMISKRKLLAEVWHQPYGGGDKTVDVHLSWLRRKLGESANEPRFIHTKRGVGVRFVNPDA